MIYIHCRAASNGAVLLAEELRNQGFRAMRTRDDEMLHRRIRMGDLIIGWGQLIPFGGVKVLNGRPSRNKLDELRKLEEGNVPIPPFDTQNWGEGWIGRSLFHQEGNDFSPHRWERPPSSFWTRKLDIEREFRFHIFKAEDGFKSIRAGEKLPRTADHHPWVRSWNHGWKISYGNDLGKVGLLRDASKKALEALGYDFGAVDVGMLRGGGAVVLEVNQRVGLEEGGQTVVKYAEAIGKIVGNG